jgi:hypothetical protein
MSLTRLSGGDALLRSIYASFSEGFDTPDLRDAKALLDSPRASA